MSPFYSCMVMKVMVIVTLLACSFLLKDGMVLVAQITTLEPQIQARQAALVDMMEHEKEMAKKRLSDMDEIISQNSDPLPFRNNSNNATELCKRTGACPPKYLGLETRVRTAPNHKMLTCIVQKSMSTVMTAIFCFLYDETDFLSKGRDLFTEWSRFRLCKEKNEYNSVATVRKDLMIKNTRETGWSFTMVTRDPVERFISGFVDRCIRKPLGGNPCNDCRYNMTCFVEREYERIMTQVKERKLKRSFEDVHLFPQNWRCELRSEYKNYEYIHYSSEDPASFITHILEIAARQNVSKASLNFLRDQITNGRTVHVTSDSPARKYLEIRLRNSSYLMEYIVKMFYYDFLLFGYPFPEGF